MIAQFLLTGLLGVVLLYAWSQYRSAATISLLVVVIALGGMYFIWLPTHATRLALWAGIGRGVDLIIYCWIGFSLIALLNLHLKIRAQTELITALARSIALANAPTHAPDPVPEDGEG